MSEDGYFQVNARSVNRSEDKHKKVDHGHLTSALSADPMIHE